MFLKLETKWLRQGEIHSCKINVATVQTGRCWDKAIGVAGQQCGPPSLGRYGKTAPPTPGIRQRRHEKL